LFENKRKKETTCKRSELKCFKRKYQHRKLIV
jgi:hypothetical protein